mmetsp:Transcript_66167/g.123492  ORF Transcript_66167/g.123492 Transcript_66167/m.123492 type:complete len:573 (-) Transcript_66167:114-1832(-)
MSPVSAVNGKNGDAVEPPLKAAKRAVRQLLGGVHITDVLVERSRVLVVDAELPVHNVISTVLQEQHGRTRSRASSTSSGLITPMAGGMSTFAEGGMSRERDRSAGGGMVRGGMCRDSALPDLDDDDAASESAPNVTLGVVSAALPSDLLAEVCDFELCKRKPTEPAAEEESVSSQRRWTSPDDGWGVQAAASLQDLARMLPMSKPFTIGEMASFLLKAMASCDEGEDGGLLSSSIARWRSQAAGGEVRPTESASAPHLVVEEKSRVGGSAVLHVVDGAPQRPILSLDDPEATLLRAVELLLGYPEVSAIPVVSQPRCAVVAHVTLPVCLMALTTRLRGSADVRPLIELPVRGKDEAGACQEQKKLQSASEPGDGKRWAEHLAPAPDGVLRPLQVFDEQQPLSDLLAFFQDSTFSKAPVVNSNGGIIGVVSRRDLLCYLDLAMQYVRPESDDEAMARARADPVTFKASLPLKEVCEALQRHPVEFDAGSTDGEGAADKKPKWLGASVVQEAELPLKAALLRILTAENCTLLFAESEGSENPQLTRMVTVSDLWRIILDVMPDAEAKDLQVVEE